MRPAAIVSSGKRSSFDSSPVIQPASDLSSRTKQTTLPGGMSCFTTDCSALCRCSGWFLCEMPMTTDARSAASHGALRK